VVEGISSGRRKGFYQTDWPTADTTRERASGTGATADGECVTKKTSVRIAKGYAREARYRTIYHYQEEFKVTRMCDFLKISRAGYYAWRKRFSRPDRDLDRMKMIEKAYLASHRTYGYRRIQIWIQQKLCLSINPKAVLRLMNKMGIHSVARRRRYYKSAEDYGLFHRYANVLNREFFAARPNQKWVTDVTFIRTRQGWAYLSTIKDLHDGFIIAHFLTKNNSMELVTRTLKLAKQKEMVADGLVLHSDQGYQYSSQAYFILTQAYNITPSMSRRGNCWDNAVMENFFSHLKEEALRQFPDPTYEEARQIIDDYVHFYNYERIQLKTRQTPFQLRCLST
jgi:transposase InsO family protein